MANPNFETRKYLKNNQFWLPMLVILIVLGIRVSLPFVLKYYVNKTLANIPAYHGHVNDIDVALWRGAYTINGLYLNKVNAKTEVPFLNFETTDVSVQWKSLFKGSIVSEIEIHNASLIYVFEDHERVESETQVEDWSKALTNLVPIDINRLTITKGKLAFVKVTTKPSIDLQINNLNLEATNLRNVIRQGNKLPSTLKANATALGIGSLNLKGQMDLVKSIPDLDLSFTLENAQAKALNAFTKHYANIDFTKGTFAVYSELAINNGHLKGYLKPILQNIKLIGDEDNFVDTLWEGFMGFFKFILKNHKKDTLATKIPLEGNLNNVQTKIFSTVFNIFKNAWIKAYQGVTDDEIEFEDAKR